MRSPTWNKRRLAFTRLFTDGGTHTITLEVVATARHRTFRLDAFIVAR